MKKEIQYTDSETQHWSVLCWPPFDKLQERDFKASQANTQTHTYSYVYTHTCVCVVVWVCVNVCVFGYYSKPLWTKQAEESVHPEQCGNVWLTDHVIGHMDLDLSLRLKRHLAFNTLVGLFLWKANTHTERKTSILDNNDKTCDTICIPCILLVVKRQ